MLDFPATAVHACACAMMGSRQVRDFPVTTVHARVRDDGEQAGA